MKRKGLLIGCLGLGLLAFALFLALPALLPRLPLGGAMSTFRSSYTTATLEGDPRLGQPFRVTFTFRHFGHSPFPLTVTLHLPPNVEPLALDPPLPHAIHPTTSLLLAEPIVPRYRALRPRQLPLHHRARHPGGNPPGSGHTPPHPHPLPPRPHPTTRRMAGHRPLLALPRPLLSHPPKRHHHLASPHRRSQPSRLEHPRARLVGRLRHPLVARVRSGATHVQGNRALRRAAACGSLAHRPGRAPRGRRPAPLARRTFTLEGQLWACLIGTLERCQADAWERLHPSTPWAPPTPESEREPQPGFPQLTGSLHGVQGIIEVMFENPRQSLKQNQDPTSTHILDRSLPSS
jgi:hypothetical protein